MPATSSHAVRILQKAPGPDVDVRLPASMLVPAVPAVAVSYTYCDSQRMPSP